MKLPVEGYVIRRVYFAVATGLLFAASGQAFGWPQIALPKIREHDGGIYLSPSDISLVVSGLFFGSVVGSLLAGLSVDLIGRTRSMIAFHVMTIAAWGSMLFFKTLVPLFIARFLIGLNSAVLYLVMSLYAAEIVPPEFRGMIFVMLACFFNAGTLFQSMIGPWITYNWIVIISLVIPVALFFGLLALPESPYYYMRNNNREGAARSLVWMYGEADETILKRIEQGVEEQQRIKASFLDIYRHIPTRKAFIMSLAMNFTQQTSGFLIVMSYSSVVLRESVISVPVSVMAINLSWLLTCIFAIRLMDILGRKKSSAISSAGVFLSMGVTTIYFFLYPTKDYSPSSWIIPIAFIFHGISHNLGLATVPAALQGELFSVNMKGKCSSILNIIRGGFATGSVALFPVLEESVGLYANFALCTLFAFLGMLFSIFYLIETSNKTLEQIQAELTNKTVVTKI